MTFNVHRSDPGHPAGPPTVDSNGDTYQKSTKQDSQVDPWYQDKAECDTDANIETFEVAESHDVPAIIPSDTNKRKEHPTS